MMGFRKEVLFMNYCLSFDVGKNKSCYGFFRVKDVTLGIKDGMECIIKQTYFNHTAEEAEKIEGRITSYSKNEIAVIMESTAVYHRPLQKYFEDRGYKLSIINPFLTGHDNSSLRKTKYDKGDVSKIAFVYFKGNCNIQFVETILEKNRRILSRLSEEITDTLSKRKTELLMKLVETAPEYEKTFKRSGIYTNSVLSLIDKYPHSDLIREANEKAVAKAMHYAKKNYHVKDYAVWAEKLKRENGRWLPGTDRDSAELESIHYLIAKIQEETIESDEKIAELVSVCEDEEIYKVLLTFRGIGPDIAAHLTAELGNMARFKKPQSIIAYAGFDPSKEQSSQSLDVNGKITKRGNKHLRRWLFVAVQSMIMHAKEGDREFADYYASKRGDKRKGGQSHHHFYAMTACCNKLIRKIYFRYLDACKAETEKTK